MRTNEREKMRKIKRNEKKGKRKKGKALSFGEGIINQSPIKFALFFFLFSLFLLFLYHPLSCSFHISSFFRMLFK